MPELAYEIVGLVKDTKYRALREETPAVVFTPLAQAPGVGPLGRFLIRSSLPPAELMASIRQTVASVSPRISTTLQVHSSEVGNLLVRERLMATLSGFFGMLAALLAVIGLYGVMSYIVALREREIGVRLALGAKRRDVLLMIVRQGATLLGAGLMFGIVLAVAAARAAATLLFGLTPSDSGRLRRRSGTSCPRHAPGHDHSGMACVPARSRTNTPRRIAVPPFGSTPTAKRRPHQRVESGTFVDTLTSDNRLRIVLSTI